MLTRRGFLSRLSAFPFLPLLSKLNFTQKHLDLPINCDLSMTALQYACNVGQQNKLGKPKLLVIPPELRWIVRKLLEGECDCGQHSRNVDHPTKPYTACSEINALDEYYLCYKIVYARAEYERYHLPISQSSWRLFFEKGSVGSVGP